MNDATKARIKQMWCGGATYGYIALTLGLTRGQVSGVIGRAGMARKENAAHNLQRVEILHLSSRHATELAILAQERRDTPLSIVEDMIDDAYEARRT